MSRIRSPNYPGISLAEALERVGALFEKEHQHTMSRDVALKGLGYSGANGASLTALSAVRKYGLVAKNGDEYRVTDRAVTILHPHSPEEKAEALKVAAGDPALFAELLGHFNGELPSDDNLRSYLVRKGFSSTALGAVIQSFRDTMSLVSTKTSNYNEVQGVDDLPAASIATSSQESGISKGRVPFQLSFGPGRLHGTFDLKYVAEADEMIRGLNALKSFLKVSDE